MNVSVGLFEKRPEVTVDLLGEFADASGFLHSGRRSFASAVSLVPRELGTAAFALEGVTIGVGFHWERSERQVFRGALRLLEEEGGLTAVNDVPLEEYVTSVVSSEMSADCPLELLKAHAVISRSWLRFPKAHPGRSGGGNVSRVIGDEITRWYGREAHRDFDVCADDHCQRYQGITRTHTPAAAEAVSATAEEVLLFRGEVCDARFSKCCGGVTELFRSAWEERDVPYLAPVADGEEPGEARRDAVERVLDPGAPAFCDTRDAKLLATILPGFDQETRDFYRWKVVYSPDEVRGLVGARLGVDVGEVEELAALERGPSGRIVRLRIAGRERTITVGKELEIRRALSRSHLLSSAFVPAREGDSFVLHGAGWGHGVGLCQIGAAVMAARGRRYREILSHYYPGASAGTLG